MSTNLSEDWLTYTDEERAQVQRELDEEMEDEPTRIPCCMCGKPTTWDITYQNLCYRCCRATNE